MFLRRRCFSWVYGVTVIVPGIVMWIGLILIDRNVPWQERGGLGNDHVTVVSGLECQLWAHNSRMILDLAGRPARRRARPTTKIAPNLRSARRRAMQQNSAKLRNDNGRWQNSAMATGGRSGGGERGGGIIEVLHTFPYLWSSEQRRVAGGCRGVCRD